MPELVLFVVDDDHEALAAMGAALQRRFGADYRIVTNSSASAGLAWLEEAGRLGETVPLIIAGLQTSQMTSLEWLARAHELCPRASRCVLVGYGEGTTYPLIRRALALGQVDTYLETPLGDPEDRLYPVVTEILCAWAKLTRPRVPVLRIVGERWAFRSHELRDLLERASVPYQFFSHEDADGRALLRQLRHSGPLPAVIFRDQCLADPSNGEIARMLGVATQPEGGLYDLIVIGGGPAGLAAAVYGASDGMRTLVIERQVVGGQAGTSSLIRNYLGFPRGVSGAELAARAHEQAMSLGVEFLPITEVTGLQTSGAERIVVLGERTTARARAVVVATGVSYNRLEIEGVDDLLGKGVFYGAATAEAPACCDQPVFVVGGGNSAGQAAAHLSRYAPAVTLIVRGDSLTMSDYLVKQLERTATVRVRLNTEIVRAEGKHHLETLALKDTVTGATERLSATALFVLIGAGPHTAWLANTLQRAENGYILTGSSVVRGAAGEPPWPEEWPPHQLETSLPGVFAAGDVRYRSPRGVAAAVADGALAARSIYEYLAGAGGH
jgi:thioredoxin reductase (NADPH)